MPRVWNINDPDRPQGHGVYVGRGTKWGNPFLIGRDGDRLDVVARYRCYLVERNFDLQHDAIRELRGQDLVCHCHPRACHADVLLEVANA